MTIRSASVCAPLFLCFIFFSHTNDYSYELKQAGYIASGVGTLFFIYTSMLGGNAAVSRYLEKDKAKTHDTKFLAHVSAFCTILNHLLTIKIFNIVIVGIIMHLECSCFITTVQEEVGI